jgi:hypothetical protein
MAPHTGILPTGASVVVSEDFSVPGRAAVRGSTRGIVESDPAWDEDSCDPDRPISLKLTSGNLSQCHVTFCIDDQSSKPIDEANGPIVKQLQCACHGTLPWLISV